MAKRRKSRGGGRTKLGRCAKSGKGLTKGKFRAHMKSCMRRK
jgi:hypothetical protein